MEIIRHGTSYRPHQEFHGECLFCTALFTCVWQECEYESKPKGQKAMWKCKCPTCSKWVYVEEKKAKE
jgi:hypothetical protein